MFTLAITPTFTHPVKVKVPVDGGYADQDFKATFKVMSADEASKFDLSDGLSTADFVRGVLVGLDDIVGAEGQPLSYSDELRDQMIAIPYIRLALITAYYKAIGGAKLGN